MFAYANDLISNDKMKPHIQSITMNKILSIRILMLISSLLFGQKISGVVIDQETKMPLKNASVYLVKPDYSVNSNDTSTNFANLFFFNPYYYNIIKSTQTDLIGQYQFDSLPAEK